jgi:hypothetical protein
MVHVSIGNDRPVPGDLRQALFQFVAWYVPGARNVTGAKGVLPAHVDH